MSSEVAMESRELTYEYDTRVPPDTRSGTAASALAVHVRRTLDIVLAFLALVLMLPVIAIIAVAIRIDSRGPVFFRQRRLGRNARPFIVHKFRTMRVDADTRPHREYVRELIAGDGDCAPTGGEGLFKLAIDDRITRVGRWVRRLSLDELPQLWDVLRGEMSLVGPRPVVPYEVEHYSSWYWRRFAVKPGMTGLWQVSGRSERTYEEMVRFDVEYVRRDSLRLYLVVLVKTVWVVFRRRGAA